MDWLWRESWGRGALKELQPIILSCPLQIPNQQRWENILEENYFQSKLTLTCHEKENGLSRLSLLRSKTAEGVSLVQVDPRTEYLFYYKTTFPFEESSVPSFVDNASFAEVFI